MIVRDASPRPKPPGSAGPPAPGGWLIDGGGGRGGGVAWTGGGSAAAGSSSLSSAPGFFGRPGAGGGTAPGAARGIRSFQVASTRSAFSQNLSNTSQNVTSPVSTVTLRSLSLLSGSCT